jgi:hypothetical protein
MSKLTTWCRTLYREDAKSVLNEGTIGRMNEGEVPKEGSAAAIA